MQAKRRWTTHVHRFLSTSARERSFVPFANYGYCEQGASESWSLSRMNVRTVSYITAWVTTTTTTTTTVVAHWCLLVGGQHNDFPLHCHVYNARGARHGMHKSQPCIGYCDAVVSAPALAFIFIATILFLAISKWKIWFNFIFRPLR